jgi:hypothetical protein
MAQKLVPGHRIEAVAGYELFVATIPLRHIGRVIPAGSSAS